MSLATIHTHLDADHIKTFMREFTINSDALKDLLPSKTIKFNPTKKYIKIPEKFEYIRATDLSVDLDDIINNHEEFLKDSLEQGIADPEFDTEERINETITDLRKHLYEVHFPLDDFMGTYEMFLKDFDVDEAADWCVVQYVEKYYN